jgi:osmotically-inducible protein OsmY
MRTISVLACVLVAACSRSDRTVTDDKPATTELTGATLDARVSDQELIRRVETAISARPDLSMAARNAEVDAVDGVVLLRGSVSDQLTKSEIERVAATVSGTATTLNKLGVRDATDVEADDTIAFSIQRALVTDPSVSPFSENVTIDVNRGLVTLRGKVGSPENIVAAQRVVERTPGVVTVTNGLTAR